MVILYSIAIPSQPVTELEQAIDIRLSTSDYMGAICFFVHLAKKPTSLEKGEKYRMILAVLQCLANMWKEVHIL